MEREKHPIGYPKLLSDLLTIMKDRTTLKTLHRNVKYQLMTNKNKCKK